MAGDGTIGAVTGGTLVSLPLLSIFVDHAMHVARTFQLSCSTASGATLIITHDLVVLGAVEDRTGSTLAGNVPLVAGAGSAWIQFPIHARHIQVPIKEASPSWWCNQLT